MRAKTITIISLVILSTFLLPARPALALTSSVSTDATTYSAGDRLDLFVSLNNPGSVVTVDVYLAVMLPDGSLLFVEYDSITGVSSFRSGDVGNSSSWTPAVSKLTLPAGYNLTDFQVLQYTFSGGEPMGPYTWYIGVTPRAPANS